MKFLYSLFFSLLILGASAFAEPRTLKIGVISGLSGAAAKWNRFQNMGIILAQEEYREMGWDISLKFEDSATEAPKAISAFNKLVAYDKVQAILADDFGIVVAPLLPLAEKRKLLLVALSLPHQRYCQSAAHYFFSMTSQFEFSRDAYEQFFIQNPQIKKVGFVVFDDPEWGNSYRKIWSELAAKAL